MDKSTILVLAAFCLVFLSGFAWGQWFAERSIRKDRRKLEDGRILVSMPMEKENAAQMFQALSILAKKAKEERHD